jgi:hypothetical protein
MAMLSVLALLAIFAVLLSPVAEEQRNRGIHVTLFAEVLPYAFVLLPYLTAFVLITWGTPLHEKQWSRVASVVAIRTGWKSP